MDSLGKRRQHRVRHSDGDIVHYPGMGRIPKIDNACHVLEIRCEHDIRVVEVALHIFGMKATQNG